MVRRLVGLVGLVAVVALGQLVACRQVAGVEDRSPPPDAGTTTRRGLDVFPDACRTCVEAMCSEQVAACSADVDCAAALACATDSSPATARVCSALALGSVPATRFSECADTACFPGCAPELQWSCAGTYSWPAPEHESATIATTFVGFVNRAPLTGLRVRACDRRDIACAEPVAEQTTDEDGAVALVVPMAKKAMFGIGADGFDGFVEVTGGNIMPSLRFQGWPIVADTAGSAALPATSDVMALASAAGVSLDPERGIVVVEPFDCFWGRAPGVRIEVSSADARSTRFYFDQGFPTADLTESSQDGTGGFLDVPRGTTTVSVRLGDAPPFATSTIFVRAGTISLVSLVP